MENCKKTNKIDQIIHVYSYLERKIYLVTTNTISVVQDLKNLQTYIHALDQTMTTNHTSTRKFLRILIHEGRQSGREFLAHILNYPLPPNQTQISPENPTKDVKHPDFHTLLVKKRGKLHSPPPPQTPTLTMVQLLCPPTNF